MRMDAGLAGIRSCAADTVSICGQDLPAVISCLQADSGFHGVVQQLSSASVPGCCKDQQKAAEQLAEARGLARRSDWPAAQRVLSSALKWAETGACWDRAALLRATALLAQKKTEAARADCSLVDGNSACFPAACMCLAGAYCAEGALPQALHMAQQAQRLLPQCSDAQHMVHRLQLSCSPAEPAAAAHDAAPCGPQQLVPLRLQDVSGEGQALHAAAHVPAGTDVLAEAPVCLAVANTWASRVCACCCSDLGPGLQYACPSCPLVLYCSPACQQRDSAVHQQGFCGAPWTRALPQETVLACKMTILAAQGSSAAAAITNLQVHQPEDPARFAELAASATLAAACLAACAERRLGQHALPVSAEQVFTNLLRVSTNAIAIVPLKHAGRETRKALAIYSCAAKLNHACSPSVAFRFNGSLLIVRTISNVPLGTPLRHCYGPQASRMPTAERRTALQQQYHFRCMCNDCSGPDTWSRSRLGLTCPSCRAVVALSRQDGSQLLGPRCSRCGLEVQPAVVQAQHTCVQQALDVAQHLQDVRVSAVTGSSQGPALASELDRLLKALEECELVLSDASRRQAVTLPAGSSAAAALWARAAQHKERQHAVLQCHYGSSCEAAFEGLQLAQLLHKAGLAVEAGQQLAQAQRVLALHFGLAADTLRDLQIEGPES